MTLYPTIGSFEETLQIVSIPTGQSFASLQFTFAQINSSGQLIPPSGAGVFCDGVVQDDNPNSGTPSALATAGISMVVSAGTVTAGDLIMTDASGRAVTATTSNHILGRAIQGNGGSTGVLIPVLLIRGGHASSGV